VTPGLGLVR